MAARTGCGTDHLPGQVKGVEESQSLPSQGQQGWQQRATGVPCTVSKQGSAARAHACCSHEPPRHAACQDVCLEAAKLLLVQVGGSRGQIAGFLGPSAHRS